VKQGSVRANGLSFATLEEGEGPLVLCLHGFPDHAPTFRHQLPALAAAGFRAVAPYMRGYAPTDAAPDGCYQSAVLGLDAVALIEALGHDDAIVFGHDWGALAGYAAALAAPQRIRKLITAAVPYGPRMATAFATDYDQQRRSWYMFFFQGPFAGGAVANDDFRFIERLWQDWSPGYRCPPADMEALKATFRSPGVVEAALGYYRATFDPSRHRADLAELQGRMMLSPIEVPSLMLHGADDGCIGSYLVEGMAAMFPRGLRTEVVPGVGHFLHVEKPDVVNRIVLDFIRS
jgi:pimeloyl-ACP methyl ester carboxylesterase